MSRDTVRISGRYRWRSGIVDTSMAGRARGTAVTEICQERSYPQFDCVGGYLWIWERLVQAEDRTDVIARRFHRDRPPSRRER
jgi:hypothetical protein